MAKLTLKKRDMLMNALNIIDEQAENGSGSYDEELKRQKAYELVSDFIYSIKSYEKE